MAPVISTTRPVRSSTPFLSSIIVFSFLPVWPVGQPLHLAAVGFQFPVDHLIQTGAASAPDVETDAVPVGGVIEGLPGVGGGFPKQAVRIDLIGMNGGDDLRPLRVEAELLSHQHSGLALAHNMRIAVVAGAAGQQLS